MIGGGIFRNETILEALDRHVKTTLGVRAAISLPSDEAHPHVVGQYFPTMRLGYGHDPRKHAVALSYWAEFRGEASPMGEAHDFSWFRLSQIPDDASFGYGHEIVVRRLIRLVEDARTE
jgi:ADP-ribose pyrophosphatase YjhB (NUDIX family)